MSTGWVLFGLAIVCMIGWGYVQQQADQAGSKPTLKQRAQQVALAMAGWGFLWSAIIDSNRSGAFVWGGLLSWVGVWLLMRVPDKPGKTGDVKADSETLKKLATPFDPEPYIGDEKARAKRGDKVFMGLDGERKPVFLPRHVLDKNHLEFLGESGTGKSSIAGVVLSQLAAAGECIVVFDPKADRNLPGALARAGERHGFPFHIIDLRPQANYPQTNPFAGCRADQVEELLQVALELGKTGDGGVDFYRGKDREATGFIADALADGRTDMLEILAKAGADERVVDQENLWRELRQLARVKALHTEEGLKLEEMLSRPGVLYVIGSTTRLEVVAAQKLILQRILQILDERRDQDMPVGLFLDELKYLLSPAALRAAGTIRDRNCHLFFAHQSLGDLDDCPGLNPKAVRGAIWGNCGIKIAYRMQDATTALELSRVAGQQIIDAKSKSENSNSGETITTKDERRDFMPPHVFTHLPKPASGEASVGVVFGLGPAFYLSTRYIESGPAPEPERAPEAGQGGATTSPALASTPEQPADQADIVTDTENTVSANDESMVVSQYSDEI